MKTHVRVKKAETYSRTILCISYLSKFCLYYCDSLLMKHVIIVLSLYIQPYIHPVRIWPLKVQAFIIDQFVYMYTVAGIYQMLC